MMRRLSLVLVLGLVLTALVVAGPVSAGGPKNCAKAVVADWYGDGRVDKIFPLRCYRQAIRSLPTDVLDYSNAKQDILRALAFAQKGEKDPGPSGAAQPAGKGGGSAVPVDSGPPGGESGQGGAGSGADAGDVVDMSGSSSLPIPLLILAGLALLLLAAGGAGYLRRRSQARHNGGPPDPV